MMDEDIPGHGGRREGAGGKPDSTPLGIALKETKLEKERTAVETSKLTLAIRRGQYVERAAVRQASAAALSSLAQTLRSVPDKLERRLAIAPEVAEAVAKAIDAALNDLADEFELMTGLPE